MAVDTEKAEATLGGKHLLHTSPVVWKLTEGVLPSIGHFDMAPDDALALEKTGGPIELVITPVQGNPVRVKQLWVLNVEPGPTPYVSRITVADRRWIWSFAHVLLRMNMRRNVGVKRILANDQFAVDFDRAFQVAFAKYSLDNKTRRFVTLRMVQKVFEQVAEKEKEFHGSSFPLKLDARVGSKIRGLPIEELQIDDPGDQAVRRALSYLPEAGVTVDYDGTVIVFSKAGGDEEAIVKAVLPEVWSEGHTDLVRNALIRPKKVRVWFTREVELRFDFIEVASTRSATVTADPLGDLRRMENVLPSPDYQLTVGANVIAQGTWITVDEAFRSWENLPLVGVTRKLDHDLVQQAFMPHMDLWAALQISGERPDALGNLRNWPGRIAAVQNHYRQTFRLNSKWMDNILSIRDYRLSTIDPQSGQRGPARAYGDYSVLYTQRSLWRNAAQGKPMDFAFNRSAFPDGGNIDSNVEPSPAVVRVLDPDQGIIHLDYRGTDPLSGDTRMILPSQIQLDSMPTMNVRQKTRPISFDTVIGGSKPPRLSPSFKVAIILTAVPASPNSKKQLHMIEVDPQDVAQDLPATQRRGLGEAQGPIMDIRIGANVEVARIQWKDSAAAEIEKIFGVREGDPDLTGLVLNEGSATDLEKGASLNQIARAAAARLYASLVDRYENETTGYMNGGVHLNGFTEEISHEYLMTGETLTRVKFPAKIPQMSLLSFLDSNTRAAILKLVQPG